MGEKMVIALLNGIDNGEFLTIAKNIAKYHHEKYDGKGYPDGLAGEDIPIWAQIVSVADVYEALVSKRVYKDAYAHDTVLEMIKNGECGQFSDKMMHCLDCAKDELRDIIKKRENN